MADVWECFPVYIRNLCDDKNVAGKGADGGYGRSGIVFVPDLSGSGKGQPGDVDAVYLCMSVSSICYKCLVYDHTDSKRSGGGADWYEKKESAVWGRTLFMLCSLSAARGVLYHSKISNRCLPVARTE